MVGGRSMTEEAENVPKCINDKSKWSPMVILSELSFPISIGTWDMADDESSIAHSTC